MMSASETIKKIRISLLIDQDQFAKKVGISRQAISNYERGVRKPSLKNIRKMKDIADENGIEVKVEDFLD